MEERSEQRFYSKLKDAFVGEKIKGDSGYVNLMNLRQQYFEKIEPFIKESVEEKVEADGAREELYDKLYTFFDAYLNETGTVFFADTQLHRNLYERVYSDRDDVSLFWKTQNLYYVKSEALYDDLETEIDGITFTFDASAMKHAKGNEKKTLDFFLTKVEDDKLTFQPRYSEQNDYDRFREHLDMEEAGSGKIKNFIYEHYPEIDHPQVKVITNSLDHSIYSKTDFTSIISVYELNDAINTSAVEFAPYKIEHILKYFEDKAISVNEEQLRKAFRIYKKQNEVDYFIHKDAKGFLSEQFNIYLYNYLFDDKTQFTEKRVQQIQTIKEIATEVIDYIARFEDELKAIWNKPKFVLNSNYVITLDRLADNIDLIEKIIEDPGFAKQIEEYKLLHSEWTDEAGNTTKKEWKEFEQAAACTKDEILLEDGGVRKLNPDYQYLPIDTRHFDALKWKILDGFDHLEEQLDGYLIKSDNYQALNTLLPKYKEKIDLIYIDPPFNTGEDFLYKDKYQDSSWLSIMIDRLILSKEFLNDRGNIFVHFDHNADYYSRMLMNKVFGEKNFINEIIWYFPDNLQGNVNGFANNHQNIFWYSKSSDYKNKKVMIELDKPVMRDKRVWSKELGKIVGARDEDGNLIYEEYTHKKADDVWQIGQSSTTKRKSKEYIEFDTQKPEELLRRIVETSTDEADLVIDYFVGSATTISVAHKMKRSWIGVEMGDHFEKIALPRMKRVLKGDESGVSNYENIKWQGGGFFKYYELEQYEEALARSAYNRTQPTISTYKFGADQKQLEAIELDYEKQQAEVHFERLYEDVDIAETLSNLTGKKIDKLNDKRVIFEDGQEIVFDEMTFGDYPWVKPLIWWNSTQAKKEEV
jgi:adenine specific DNA methylase Mod